VKRRKRLDPARLRRALFLEAEPAGPGAWIVSGGAAVHRVEEHRGRLTCDCIDHAVRGGACKHIVRALLCPLHPVILAALRTLVERPNRKRSPDNVRPR